MKHLVLIVLLLGSCLGHVEFFQNIVTCPITTECRLQYQEFIANINTSWALDMMDSNSKIPMGMVTLQFEDMGDFYKCTHLNTGIILGKYCLGYVQVGENTSLTIRKTITLVPPIWSLCLPSKCSTKDANIVGTTILQHLLETEEIGVNFPPLLCQTLEEVEPKLTVGAVVAIVVLSCLFLTVIVSTLCDLYCTFHGSKCHFFVKSFSVYSNGCQIFQLKAPSSEELPCLDGLKFISMIWVVIIHQYLVPMDGTITNTLYLKQWPQKLYSMFVISGSISVDTFLTVGGTLTGYYFTKSKKLNFSFFHYYLHRYLRLTSSLAVVVLVSSTLLQYLGSGPQWPFFTRFFQRNCEEYWWSALLYVQNYVNPAKMCIGQTWYNNVDMQLYFISPFVFFILVKYPKWGLTLLGMASGASMSSSFYEAWTNDLPAIEFSAYSPKRSDYETNYYLLTHTRATPWIVGAICGYFIAEIKQRDKKYTLNATTTIFFWTLSLGTLFVCVLAGHGTFLHENGNKWANSFYIAMVRPVWSLAIAWVILACCNGYGGPINWVLSLRIYKVFNKFTYSMYLTHVTLLYGITYGRTYPDYFSEFNRAYQFWGTLWFTVGLAAVLVFVAEAPVAALEKKWKGMEL